MNANSFQSSGLDVSFFPVVFGHKNFKGKQKEIVEAAHRGIFPVRCFLCSGVHACYRL